MPEPALQIVVASSAALGRKSRDDMLRVCSRAYEEDFSAYLEMLGPAMHVLAYLEDELVSHAAWVDRQLRAEGQGSLRTAYVEAVATLPEHQGHGYASAILSRIPLCVAEFDLAALSPSAESFYRRLGWELWEGPLAYVSPSGEEVPTPEEQVMIFRLPLTPASLDRRVKLTTDWRPIEVW